MASQFFESNLELNPIEMLPESTADILEQQEPRFRLRACNKENYNDIAAVLELFQSHYGQNHPLPKALTDSFWKEPENQLDGEEFLSLVVEDLDAKKPVAHIALAFREDDQHVEILLPAIDPEYRSSLNSLFNICALKVSEIVIRKKWERLLFLCSTSDPLLQLIAHTYLSAKATAFISSGTTCPATAHLECKIGKIKENTKHPYILLSTSITGSKVSGPVYIPNSLKRFINTRARLLKISFSYGEGKEDINPFSYPLAKRKISKRKMANHLHYSNRGLYGISIIDCYPSESDEVNSKLINVISRLKRKTKTSLSLRICLNSHLAPKFIQLCKELGYLPSGIDIKSNRLYLILSELDKETMNSATLFSREAKTLREDILSRRWV